MKKKRTAAERILLPAAMLLLVGVLVYSGSQIFRCLRETEESRQIQVQMAELAVSKVPEPEPAELQQPQEPMQEEKTALPPMPISVDFEQLQAQNADVIAWIYGPDTPINYPVVKGTDNSYYLNHMIDGRINPSGTIFMDYRCDAAMTDQSSVIYGHNLKDQAMFGSLLHYADQAYYEAHPTLFLLTPEKNYVVQLIAGFVTDSNDGLFALPITEEKKEKLIKNAMERSDFEPTVQPVSDERLIVLSTCSYAYEDARYVVVGMLRES